MPEEPASEALVSTPSASHFLTQTGTDYSAHRNIGIQTFQRSALAARNSNADAALSLIILHELGHDFARTYGLPDGLDGEQFADRFAVNYLVSLKEFRPRGLSEARGYIEALQGFLRHVPTGAHLGDDLPADIDQRQSDLSCAYVGHLANFAVNDPYVEAAASMGFAPEMADVFRQQTSLQGLSQPEWRSYAAGEQAFAASAVARARAADPYWVDDCADQHASLRQFLMDRLSTQERFNRLVDQYGRTQGDDVAVEMNRIGFEYELPESEGAWILFALVAPADGATMPGSGFLLGHARMEGWLPGPPGLIVLSLKYCGIGLANASIVRTATTTRLTLCYEIMEEMLQNLQQYGAVDPADAAAARDYAYRLSPDYARRTDEMMGDAAR